MNEWRRAMLCYAAYHATLSELKIMNEELERSTTLFDPRKEITEIKELAEKGETHANELLKRLVALLHKMIHHEGERYEDIPADASSAAPAPPPDDPNPDPVPGDVPATSPDPNQQPSNIGGDEPVQEPA